MIFFFVPVKYFAADVRMSFKQIYIHALFMCYTVRYIDIVILIELYETAPIKGRVFSRVWCDTVKKKGPPLNYLKFASNLLPINKCVIKI